MLSIAELAGPRWYGKAKAAVEEFGTGGDEGDEQNQLVLLLTDIRDAFGANEASTTSDLLADLNGIEESPWGARRRGEGIDARGLARMLRPFKIRPRKVRVPDGVLQGYRFDQFEDAFARHLKKAEQAEHPEQPAPGLEPDVPDVLDVPDNSPRGANGNQETLGAAWDRLERERKRDTGGVS